MMIFPFPNHIIAQYSTKNHAIAVIDIKLSCITRNISDKHIVNVLIVRMQAEVLSLNTKEINLINTKKINVLNIITQYKKCYRRVNAFFLSNERSNHLGSTYNFCWVRAFKYIVKPLTGSLGYRRINYI